MLEKLVCPECGNDSFERRVVLYTEQTGNYYNGSLGFDSYEENVTDCDEDTDWIQCGDCRTEFDAAGGELITEDAYNDKENEDA